MAGRVHRIHLPELTEGIVAVSGREAVHLAQVLRVAPGSRVRAFDGAGREADGVVVEAEADRVVIELERASESGLESSLEVTVAVALLKGDKLANVVRQCTELGATRFTPLLTRRRDVPELSANKLERLRRVAREAAKQSGRAVVPDVGPPLAPSELTWQGSALLAHPEAGATLAGAGLAGAGRTAAGLAAGGPITTISGPEGGFAPEEIDDLAARGAFPLRLGPRVLRAETAPVALLAALLLPEAL